MKMKVSTIVIIAVTIIFLYLAGKFGFTIISIEAAEETVQNEAFDPLEYVEGIWDSQMIPAFETNSVNLATILSEVKPNADGTATKDQLITIAEKYGLITVGEAHVYMVKGSGMITAVDTESSLGTAELKLDGYDGPITTRIYIGPRIPSDETSVRDAVGFISFGDFKEQTEYGKVASEINKYVLANSLAELDLEKLIGKSISFKGAFTIRTFNLVQIDMSDIRVVPVEVDLGE